MKAVHLPAYEAFLRYLEIPGRDPPLLWLHGWQCTSSGELLEAAVQPSLSGRRSLLIDFLGHGYSDRPEKFGYTLEDHADTIVTLLDALGLMKRPLAAVLVGLAMPRWYLHGELSEPEPDYERFLAESGIGFRIVPAAGHPMGLQNPAGLAATVAGIVAESGQHWS